MADIAQTIISGASRGLRERQISQSFFLNQVTP
jgi:hypothetical protein